MEVEVVVVELFLLPVALVALVVVQII